MILADVFLKILNMSFTGAVVALIVMFVRIASPKISLHFMDGGANSIAVSIYIS